VSVVFHPRHPLTGRQIQITCASPLERDAYAATFRRWRTELALGLTTPEAVARALRRLEHGPATVARACLAYAEVASANTARRVRSNLRGLLAPLAACELEALDGARLGRWIAELRIAGASDASIGVAWTTLRSAARHAVRAGWITQPAWGAWRPVLAQAASAPKDAARTVRELGALLEAAWRLDVERRARGRYSDTFARIAAIGGLGLRNAEAAALGWDDFADDGAVPVVACTVRHQTIAPWRGSRPTAPVKGRRACVLAVDDELAEVLKEHRAYLRSLDAFRVDGPVFPSPLTLRWSTHSVCLAPDTLREVAARAGLDARRFTTSSLRCTFVTLEARASGGDLRRVADRSRHASIGSLLRYLRSSSRELAPPGFAVPALSART
jgi:integrase